MGIQNSAKEVVGLSLLPNTNTNINTNTKDAKETRSSWLNCALRNDEAVYWISIGHCEAVAVGN